MAITALIGITTGIVLGTFRSWNDIAMYAGVLGIIVIFYFLVLLCKAVFTFITGGDNFWWEKYEGQKPKK